MLQRGAGLTNDLLELSADRCCAQQLEGFAGACGSSSSPCSSPPWSVPPVRRASEERERLQRPVLAVREHEVLLTQQSRESVLQRNITAKSAKPGANPERAPISALLRLGHGLHYLVERDVRDADREAIVLHGDRAPGSAIDAARLGRCCCVGARSYTGASPGGGHCRFGRWLPRGRFHPAAAACCFRQRAWHRRCCRLRHCRSTGGFAPLPAAGSGTAASGWRLRYCCVPPASAPLLRLAASVPLQPCPGSATAARLAASVPLRRLAASALLLGRRLRHHRLCRRLRHRPVGWRLRYWLLRPLASAPPRRQPALLQRAALRDRPPASPAASVPRTRPATSRKASAAARAHAKARAPGRLRPEAPHQQPSRAPPHDGARVCGVAIRGAKIWSRNTLCDSPFRLPRRTP